MNTIKYVNAAGKTARVKVSQAPNAKKTMARADWHMLQAGFRRAGLRWRKAA